MVAKLVVFRISSDVIFMSLTVADSIDLRKGSVLTRFPN